ncbi:unnamed protein product [Ilex paraguariensis]|uniref:Uncharacterized protein n=1 Tax=Ilex paraguariensis TaxID=185542 RepID=A0ABC8REW5_9AQUA
MWKDSSSNSVLLQYCSTRDCQPVAHKMQFHPTPMDHLTGKLKVYEETLLQQRSSFLTLKLAMTKPPVTRHWEMLWKLQQIKFDILSACFNLFTFLQNMGFVFFNSVSPLIAISVVLHEILKMRNTGATCHRRYTGHQ